jgi:hypothetical protein
MLGLCFLAAEASCNPVSPGALDVRQFGAAGDGVRDDTHAIQAGLDVASAGGGVLYLPPGTYLVRPSRVVGAPDYHAGAAAQFGPLHSCLAMRSGVEMRGDRAVIRLADAVSTDRAPVNLTILHASAPLSRLSFQGLTFDLNGTRNPISPNRNWPGQLHERYSRMHHSAIMFSGPDGAGTDVTIRHCRFINSAGVNCIIAGFIVPATGLGRRWIVEDCEFLENGLDSYDHSSVYLWAEESVVRRCTFRNAAAYGRGEGSTGINAACELHGADSSFENNIVDGSNRGVYMATNGVRRCDNLRVAGNRFYRQQHSFADLYYEGGGDPPPSGWEIVDNKVRFDPVRAGNVPDQMLCAVSIIQGGPIASVLIARNAASRPLQTFGHSGAFCVIGLVQAGFGEIVVEGNVTHGFTNGIYAYGIGSPLYALDTLISRGNRWLDLAGGTVPPLPKAAVHLLLNATTIGRVIVDGDTLTGSGNMADIAGAVVLRGRAPGGIRSLSVTAMMLGSGIPRRLELVNQGTVIGNRE